MKTNYHSHTRYCNHSDLTIVTSVELHRKAGYNILGISEHAPVKSYKDIFRLQEDEVDTYIKKVRDENSKFNDIDILCGLEVEYILDNKEQLEYIRDLRKKVDYMILANHIIGDHRTGDFIHFSRNDPKPHHLEKNVRLLKEGWATGLFAFIAHPDSVLKRYHWDEHAHNMAHEIGKWAEESGAILEVNANGIRFGGNRSAEEGTNSYTNLNFWKILSNYKINVIVNGDTHNPTEVDHHSEKEALNIVSHPNFTIINKLEL